MCGDLELDLDIACHVNVVSAAADDPAALAGIVAAGYGRVVLPPLPGDADAEDLAGTFARAGVVPITIAGQVPGADVSSPDADERAAGERLLRETVELTARLGGDQMNGVPYGVFGARGPVDAATFSRAAEAVGRVAEYARENGIVMTFEVLNRYETAMVNTAAQAMEFAVASGSENLRIHLDTFHMAVEEADPAGAVRTALPRLQYLELGQSGRGPLSSGAMDIPRLVAQALDDGYAGRWGIEAFSRTVLDDPVADMLAIWRSPYTDGLELAADARRVIRQGWCQSSAGRRAQRLARASS